MNKGTLVQDHVCPSCGGVLSVDLKRQMYECPFCGVTFDYDYFREEAVLGIAKGAEISKSFVRWTNIPRSIAT